MEKAYLKTLQVSDGCFSGEKGVIIENYDGDKSSGFFENEHIKNGKLEVAVIKEKDGLALVKLPGRTMEGDGDKGYITVNKKQLEAVA